MYSLYGVGLDERIDTPLISVLKMMLPIAAG